MNLPRPLTLSLILLLSLCLLQCTVKREVGSVQPQVMKDGMPPVAAISDQFGIALEKARREARKDEFAMAFQVEAKLSLPGERIKISISFE